MKAMILAAGLGTRLKPFTDKHPKALAPVNGKPVLQRNIEWLQQYGIWDVVVNVHHFAGQIIAAVNNNDGWGSRVTISDETDEVLETGGGILKAGWFLKQDANALVMNADILTDMPLNGMIEQHEKNKPLATLAVSNRRSSRYLLFDEGNLTLTGWRNKKTNEQKGNDGNEMAFSGIQILSKKIFDLIPFKGRFSMIDVYLELCGKNRIEYFDHSGSRLLDIGTIEKLAEAETMFS